MVNRRHLRRRTSERDAALLRGDGGGAARGVGCERGARAKPGGVKEVCLAGGLVWVPRAGGEGGIGRMRVVRGLRIVLRAGERVVGRNTLRCTGITQGLGALHGYCADTGADAGRAVLCAVLGRGGGHVAVIVVSAWRELAHAVAFNRERGLAKRAVCRIRVSRSVQAGATAWARVRVVVVEVCTVGRFGGLGGGLFNLIVELARASAADGGGSENCEKDERNKADGGERARDGGLVLKESEEPRQLRGPERKRSTAADGVDVCVDAAALDVALLPAVTTLVNVDVKVWPAALVVVRTCVERVVWREEVAAVGDVADGGSVV